MEHPGTSWNVLECDRRLKSVTECHRISQWNVCYIQILKESGCSQEQRVGGQKADLASR